MSEEEELKRPPHVVSKKETWDYIKSRPEELERTIVLGVAQGSTLRRIASNFGIHFSWLYEHVVGDPGLNKKYEAALVMRKEFMNQWLFDEFQNLANSDIRDSLRMKALEHLAKHVAFIVDAPKDSSKLSWEELIIRSMQVVGERNAVKEVRQSQGDIIEHQNGSQSRTKPQASGGDSDGNS